LWNKKKDKAKAFERIARRKLKLPLHAGGINAPDIYVLDQALKYRQVVRSTDESCVHSINYLQKELIGYKHDKIFQPKVSCKFINRACEVSNRLGALMFDEIVTSNDDSRLHKLYYDLLASEDPNLVFANLNFHVNSIIQFQTKVICKTFRLCNIGQLINEFKFPSTDNYRIELFNIITNSPLKYFANRITLSYGYNFRDGMVLASNQILKSCNFTTKMVKNRLLLGNEEIQDISEFKNLKKIRHPKEREIAYFKLHNVILSNDKLFKMKLINTNLCTCCDVVQDQYHIFNMCTNALNAEIIINSLECDPLVIVNIRALKDRYLFLNRDKIITSDMWTIIFKNRIKDFEFITDHKISAKRLKEINKLSLA